MFGQCARAGGVGFALLGALANAHDEGVVETLDPGLFRAGLDVNGDSQRCTPCSVLSAVSPTWVITNDQASLPLSSSAAIAMRGKFPLAR